MVSITKEKYKKCIQIGKEIEKMRMGEDAADNYFPSLEDTEDMFENAEKYLAWLIYYKDVFYLSPEDERYLEWKEVHDLIEMYMDKNIAVV